MEWRVVMAAAVVMTIPPAARAFWDVLPSPPETCPGLRTFLAAPSDIYISGERVEGTGEASS